MKKFLVMILLCALTLPVFAENSILVLGDSLSSGFNIDIKQGWVHLLQNRLNEDKFFYKVINASISGNTTSDGLSRLPPLLKEHRPLVTIIELAGNDGLRGLQIFVIRNNLNKILDLVTEAKSQAIVLGVRIPPNYGSAYTQAFQKIFQDLTSRNDVIVIPNFLAGIDDNPSLMQGDGIHPNENAQAKLVDNIWPALKKVLISIKPTS